MLRVTRHVGDVHADFITPLMESSRDAMAPLDDALNHRQSLFSMFHDMTRMAARRTFPALHFLRDLWI